MLSTLNSNVLDRDPVNKKRKRVGNSDSFDVSLKTWYKIVILYTLDILQTLMQVDYINSSMLL